MCLSRRAEKYLDAGKNNRCILLTVTILCTAMPTCDELIKVVQDTTKTRDDVPPHIVRGLLIHIIEKIKELETKLNETGRDSQSS